MEKEFNLIRSVLGKYEKYILEKRKQQDEIKRNEASKKKTSNNINLLFIPGLENIDDEEEDTSKDVKISEKKISFKTLKEYIDIKISDKRSLFINRVVHDILVAREYGKHDLEHMVTIIDLIRNDIINYIDNENRRKIEEFEMNQKRIEEEKNKISAIVPRFSCGSQFHVKEWNEFVYRDQSIIKDISLHYSSFGSIFMSLFMSLVKDINGEEDIVNIANAVNCPVDKKLLSNLPTYRTITHYIGFFFNDPMIEKELNEHISFTCHFIWWSYYAFSKNIDDKEFIKRNMNNAFEQFDVHYKTHLSSLWKKQIRLYGKDGQQLNHFFDNCCMMIHIMNNMEKENNGLVEIFIFHNDEKIELLKQSIANTIVEMNRCFNDIFVERTKQLTQETQRSDIIELSDVKSVIPTQNEVSDFFDGEKLLEWFCDTNVNQDLLFSRFSTIYFYDNEQSRNIVNKFIIAHKASDYVNYQKYNLLASYLDDNTISRIIPGDNASKLPMLNLSGYLSSYFGAVVVNPYAFENNPQKSYPIICENIFFMMLFVIEYYQLGDIIPWPRVNDNDISIDLIVSHIDEHILYRDINNDFCSEKWIIDEIFNNVCKRCLFSTAKGIIDYFMCVDNEITAMIQSYFNMVMKQTKSRNLVKIVIINEFITGKKTRQDGISCLQYLIYYILFQTYNSSTARFIVALRALQNMYHNINLKSKPQSSASQENDLKSKLELEMTRRLLLVLKNKKYQESIWKYQKEDPLLNNILNLSHFDQREVLNTFKKSTSSTVLIPFVNNLIHILFVFMKEKISDIDQSNVIEYTVKYITKIFSLMNELKTMKPSWFLKCLVKHGIETNNFYVDFIDNICKYYRSLASPDNRRIIQHIYTNLEFYYKQKLNTSLMNGISKFHELFRTLIIFRLYYIFETDDEMPRIIFRLIDDKKDAIIAIQQKEMQKSIVNTRIGMIKTSNEGINLSDVSSIFEKKSTQEMAEYFNVINFFTQLIALFSHHYNWQNASESATCVFLQKLFDNSPTLMGVHSYHDPNEEKSSMIRINREIDFKLVEEAIFVLMSFEKLIIEKTEKRGDVFSSLSQLYGASEKCRLILSDMGIHQPEECVSHTPESKMIAWMMTFIKHKFLRTYDRALRESRYPEDGFVIILTEEKMSSIELIQSIMNYIISVYARSKLAASVMTHTHIKKKDQSEDEMIYNTDDFILNPLKYAIKDALLNHPFHVRMLQLYIKERKIILSKAWLILPYKITREKIGTGNDYDKTLAYLNENSVDVNLFDKKRNPKNYLMWRFWFMNLPFVDNTILLKHHKPKRGCAYFLTEEFSPMPSSNHSDSSVLSLSNNTTSSACCSSSSSQ